MPSVLLKDITSRLSLYLLFPRSASAAFQRLLSLQCFPRAHELRLIGKSGSSDIASGHTILDSVKRVSRSVARPYVELIKDKIGENPEGATRLSFLFPWPDASEIWFQVEDAFIDAGDMPDDPFGRSLSICSRGRRRLLSGCFRSRRSYIRIV